MDIQKEREAFEGVFPCSVGTALNEYGHYESKINQQDAMIQNISWVVWQAAKAQAAPESTGLTDVNGKLIFVGDTVEFIGGCRDFLDLSGYGSRKYIVNKGDQMIVRKLKSGYTLSLPWIDCDTPNRIGNLGNYDFWNIHRDFVVIEAQEQAND